ncbi:MAG: DEAD/DEAH box helicase [Micromonosporaceae bacterium]|nr:DEAD/DEAH box helicase [Micromonosporaceae bacterium]
MTSSAPAATAPLLDLLRARYGDGRITHVERLPARSGTPAPWPGWVPAPLRAALAGRGVAAPWRHQAEAASLARDGRHVVVATGTASGKSLAYQLPVLSRLLTDPRSTGLYLAPTKALAADQLRAVTALELPRIRAACYDGDTPREEREWIRAHARFVLTNPDMLHWGILPGNRQWRLFLKQLAYVVVDEIHAYRGVFGSHVAHLLRRLRRLTGAPVFVLASATTGDPASTASRLTGLDVTAVTDDASPRGAVTFVLWEPPLLDGSLPRPRPATDDAAPVRRSALAESADLLADAVSHDIRTLAFVRSRRGAEVLASTARGALEAAVPGLGRRVAAYRGGYLPEERRTLEQALQDGRLRGLATTTALELGVDLVGLDAVVLCGYPGRLASLWQQAGRAGRAGQDALCVLVARDDPLDTYLVHHPAALFGTPVEATVLDPTNPYVLGPQLCAAAAESALTTADIARFGGQPAADAIAVLTAAGALRRRPTGWYWTRSGRPDLDLRGTGGGPVAVVEGASGRLLGTVDGGSAHFLVHPGAVYLHQGVSYVVDTLDLDDAVALVHPETPQWYTHARDTTDLSVVDVRSAHDAGPVSLFLGTVDVTNQVVSYQRRVIGSGRVIGTYPLDLPERQLRTVAVWFTISPEALTSAGVEPAEVPGALHAAEHAAIGLLPLVATCDRWDIGGLSTAMHPDTAAPTIFVYDGHPGGAGFAERAHAAAWQWLSATRDVIAQCPCETGCPSCVQSPKCGNGNQPLAKTDAVRALAVVLSTLAHDPGSTPAAATL